MYTTTGIGKKRTTYNFSKYAFLLYFADDLYIKKLTLKEAEDEQNEMLKDIEELEKK